MLLERFGLWDVRAERAASYSRGMVQRLALCRALLHDPELLVLDEPFTALDAEGAELLDRRLRELAGMATVILTTHDPARATGAGHAARDAPVRAVDAGGLPLRAPVRGRRGGGAGPALGGARLHRAARARPRVGARTGGRSARRACTGTVGPERNLARQVGRRLRLPRRDRAGGAARVRALLLPAGRRRGARRPARERRHLRRRHPARRDGGRQPHARAD